MMIKNYYRYIKEQFDDDEFEDEIDVNRNFITKDKDFKQFLIDNNCLEEYIQNCNNEEISWLGVTQGDDVDVVFKRLYDNYAESQYLSMFDANLTPEGKEFWDDINNKWLNSGIIGKSHKSRVKELYKKKNYIKEHWEDDDDMDYEEEDDPDAFITDQEFKKFLIDNKCLTQYVNNTMEAAESGNLSNYAVQIMDNFGKISNGGSIWGRQYLDYSFPYQKTPEGNQFWQHLSAKWMEIVNKDYYDSMKKLYREKIAEMPIPKEDKPTEKELDDMTYNQMNQAYRNLQRAFAKEIKKNLYKQKKDKVADVLKGTCKDFITNDKFREFLKKHDCYDLYIKNSYIRPRTSKFQDNFQKLATHRYFTSAFNWGVKEQYWAEIHNAWIDECDGNKAYKKRIY